MLRVHDLMTPHVVTLSPESTLREAIDTLVACRIGGAPVVGQGRVMGVLSMSDILEFESEMPHSSSTIEAEQAVELEEADTDAIDETDSPPSYFTDLWSDSGPTVVERFEVTRGTDWDSLRDHVVAEAMSVAICSVSSGLEVSAAALRMLEAGVQRALVMEKGALVGILTTTDILRAVAEHRLTVRQYVFNSPQRTARRAGSA